MYLALIWLSLWSSNYLKYKSSSNHFSFIDFQLKGRRSSTRIILRVYCNANYYGADCDTYCVAQDNSRNGHYTCDDSTGNKICRKGWRGHHCLTRKGIMICANVIVSCSQILIFWRCTDFRLQNQTGSRGGQRGNYNPILWYFVKR